MLERHGNTPEPAKESTSVIEIETRVADVDARQLAATESEIQAEFEKRGRELGLLPYVAER